MLKNENKNAIILLTVKVIYDNCSAFASVKFRSLIERFVKHSIVMAMGWRLNILNKSHYCSSKLIVSNVLLPSIDGIFYARIKMTTKNEIGFISYCFLLIFIITCHCLIAERKFCG